MAGFVTPKIPPLTKMFGGKTDKCRKIISLFGDISQYKHFLFPTIGGGSVELNLDRPAGSTVVAADRDAALVAAWSMLRDNPKGFLYRLRSAGDPSPKAWETLLAYRDTPNRCPSVEIVIRRWSRSGMGDTFSWTPESTRLRRGMQADMSAWLSFLDRVPMIADRVSEWSFLSLCMSESLRKVDYETTFRYIDPPYPPDVRVSRDVYTWEMPSSPTPGRYSHEELLGTLVTLKGKTFISSYPNELYDDILLGSGWSVRTFDVANSASQAKTKPRKVEALYESP